MNEGLMSEGWNDMVALIGWPVDHSISPAMHNAAFQTVGLPWRYSLLPTPAEGVETAMGRLRREGYRGANVTVPHKQAVIPYLDEVDEAARIIGAVNTIVVEEGRLTGYNTDAEGFLAALREGGFEPGGRRALVLGAGGGARAVVYALAGEGCAVTILNRTARRAAQLAAALKGVRAGVPVTAIPAGVELVDLPLASFDLLVHTTPLGMWPQVKASPWPETLPVPAQWHVFDLVYNPRETRLLAQARAAGATASDGLGMLVYQGALGFELWTGCPPPLGVMRRAAEEALGQSNGFPGGGTPCCDS